MNDTNVQPVAVGPFGEPVGVERLAELLPNLDHLMFPKKWDGSGTGTLAEAASEQPDQFSAEMQELANAVWAARQADHRAETATLVDVLRDHGYYLSAIGSGGYFGVLKRPA